MWGPTDDREQLGGGHQRQRDLRSIVRRWWHKPVDDFGRPLAVSAPMTPEAFKAVSQARNRIERRRGGKQLRRRKLTAREAAWVLSSCGFLFGGFIVGGTLGWPWGLVVTAACFVPASLCLAAGGLGTNSDWDRRVQGELVRIGLCGACCYVLPTCDQARAGDGDEPPPGEGVCCPECGAWWKWPDESPRP